MITIESGVLVHEADARDAAAGATVRMIRPERLMTLFADMPAEPRIASGAIMIDGDQSLYTALIDLIEPLNPNFPIVTP